MKRAVLVLLTSLLLTAQAGVWKPMKVGTTPKFEFYPESNVFDIGIVPKANLANLNINMAMRLYSDKDKMLGIASFVYQMKGRKVQKSYLRLGTKVGKNIKYCFDRRILKGQLPGDIFIDLTDPSVFVINKARSPNFSGNKACGPWRSMMAKKKITSANIILTDNGKNVEKQLDIRHRVINIETATTTFEPITYATTGEGFDNIVATEQPEPRATSADICSVYSNGVIDTFDKKSELYDLKCYHVLAASFAGESWFIYGAYDSFDGKKSCSSLSIYVGSKAFEIGRGWMINYNGEKFKYTEGDEKEITDSGCVLSLQNLYLTVDCRSGGFPFRVHYDGYMLAHIELFERDGSEMGLCFQNSRGRRVNWQIINQHDMHDCTISPEISDCAEDSPLCAEFADSCDDSLVRACREIYCGQTEPTSEQICSLSQARKKKCQLLGSKVNGPLTGCPDDVCVRKFFVLGAGCPQDPFFTGCVTDHYLGKMP